MAKKLRKHMEKNNEQYGNTSNNMENTWKTHGKHMEKYGKHMEQYGKHMDKNGKHIQIVPLQT